MSGYLVTACKVNYPGQGTYELKAGMLVVDPVLIAGVAAAGGALAPVTALTTAAAAICAKLRGTASSAGQGQNEDACDKVMLAVVSAGIQHVTIDIPLATIQAQTTGVAFNIGSVLPANARLFDADVVIVTPISGGGITAAHATVQATGDGAGALIGSTNVFTGALAIDAAIGTNPYPSRGGQQLQMTLTSASAALSAATAGHLQFEYFYEVIA